jgi:hypothetical protein
MPGTPVRPAAATRELSPPVNGTDERLDVLIDMVDRLLTLHGGETVDTGAAPGDTEPIVLEEPVRPAKKVAARKRPAR